MVVGEIYHIFTRSIANFRIFHNDSDFNRIQQLIQYYQIDNNLKFSDYIIQETVQKQGFNNSFKVTSKDKKKLVQIIAYCLMPTHIHLILKQLNKKGISDYIRRILNSYSSYFNTKHKRKGPLWESRFQSVRIENDEQLLHLTRYLHLNPVTASLIKNPEDWSFSSYKEYLFEVESIQGICKFDDLMEIRPLSYRNFVNNQISYQKELAKLKKMIID